MSIFCTFHRTAKAHFHCYQCGSAFCENCISIREIPSFSGKDTEYFCPGCNMPAKMMSLGNLISPFWLKLTSIFMYPFQLTPLILTTLLAALATIFSGSLLVNIVVWIVMVKYAYAVLTWTAQGSLKAPKISVELINNDVLQVFKQFGLFFLVAAISAAFFEYTGTIGGIAFMIFIALALPAIIIILVSSNSILQALNPITSSGIILRIGWPYFLMYLFLFFLMAAPTAVFSIIPETFPVPLVVFAQSFFQQFYTIIAFHLMGYVLLQYHYELGYHVDYDFFMEHRGKKRKKSNPQNDLLTGIAVLVKAGKYEEAIELVKPHIMEDEVDVEVSEKFLQILQMAGKNDVAPKYAARHLTLLIQKEKKQKATTLYSQWQLQEDFTVEAEQLLKIGRWYEQQKEFKKAIKAYVHFVNTFKSSELKPDVYFYLAKLLHEQSQNSAKAKQIFTGIIKSYPSHKHVSEARKYLAVMG